MKVLVTGGRGLVGSAFVERAKTHFQILSPGSADLDITDDTAVKAYLDEHQPDYLVNFAAYTDVNQAEGQRGDKKESCWQINTQSVETLCRYFTGRQIIQISTDMVFSGDLSQPGPYLESSPRQTDPDKLTWYGYTKSEAEQIILDHGFTVLRIIYPARAVFPDKLDYIRSFLAKYRQGTIYPVFDDQQICVSSVYEISDTITAIIDQDKSGIFHCSSDVTTPYQLLTYTLYQLGLDPDIVPRGSVAEFLKTQPNPYRYPQYGGLNCHQTSLKLGIHFSSWQTLVEHVVAEGIEY
jgi:dTDP-4-dehydrorhamnose reductase